MQFSIRRLAAIAYVGLTQRMQLVRAEAAQHEQIQCQFRQQRNHAHPHLHGVRGKPLRRRVRSIHVCPGVIAQRIAQQQRIHERRHGKQPGTKHKRFHHSAHITRLPVHPTPSGVEHARRSGSTVAQTDANRRTHAGQNPRHEDGDVRERGIMRHERDHEQTRGFIMPAYSQQHRDDCRRPDSRLDTAIESGPFDATQGTGLGDDVGAERRSQQHRHSCDAYSAAKRRFIRHRRAVSRVRKKHLHTAADVHRQVAVNASADA